MLSCSVFAWCAEESVVDNNQIKLTYNTSALTLAPGHKTTLVIDIEPKPNVHLYAQGAKGYLPVNWQMEQSKAWTAFPPVYPASHMVNLPAINETVPVFSDRIRLARDITLGSAADLESMVSSDGTLRVAGSLQYQACDDKLCYFPKTIPLNWTIKLGQPDLQRVPDNPQAKTR
jgi:hypothetical protein